MRSRLSSFLSSFSAASLLRRFERGHRAPRRHCRRPATYTCACRRSGRSSRPDARHNRPVGAACKCSLQWPDRTFVPPTSDRLIGQINPAFCQEIFDISQARCDTKIEPDGVSDYVRMKTMSLEREVLHGPLLSNEILAGGNESSLD